MINPFEQHDSEQGTEDMDLLEIQRGGEKVTWAGITRPGGEVYLQGDLHPLGSATALLSAAKANVPYASVNAVTVLYPAEWLAAECLHDHDRLRVIANLCTFVRGQ